MATKTVNRIAEKNGHDDAALIASEISNPSIEVFRIVGTSPLLQNNPEAFIGKDDGGIKAGTKVYVDADEAKMRLYVNQDGAMCHPTVSFRKAILAAATGKKFGKASATALVKRGIFVVESDPLSVIEGLDGKPIKDYQIDKRSVCVGSGMNKSRVMRCRPLFLKWQMNVVLEIDLALLTVDQVKTLLAIAGRQIGIGDFRPEKGGGCGRFQVK